MTTEPPINSAEPQLSAEAVNVWARPSRRKRALLAGLLSFLFAGMGQLYNRQPRKAVAFAVISQVPRVLLLLSRVLFSFRTMLATLILSLFWKILITVDAAYTSVRSSKTKSLSPIAGIAYSVLARGFFVAGFFPTIQQIKNRSGFAAFKVPSSSMCPTICAGERIIADMHAYRTERPRRGDLVLVDMPAYNTLFVKRVIAVSGDVVAPGTAGSVMVNGRQFRFPVPCAAAPQQIAQSAYDPMFPSTTVPQGSYFVVGDNLLNSLDSRYPEFGDVTLSMVQGRPLYLYWSPARSRIGCSLH